ncbi:hypothetical protein SAMN05216439_1153 [Methanobrevibacter gottschalkii]|uniref:Uncharacterized protein n=1 Tax=Methanobrevibacter gottschalkii TaxID=190974 RepID=A0A1H7I5X8_9EURY|nr:hypothetical protein [Methanobrevibacter gottschalkii]SEK57828.1 hypothetical protein SAMN05216439_1153 [Methanobrevibacter gottschalkii]
MNRLIDLCYDMSCHNEFKYYNADGFVFKSMNGFTQIDSVNMIHTVLFKIRIRNHDFGVYFKHPLVLSRHEAIIKKWNLKRLDTIDYGFYNEYHTFDEVIDVPDYVTIDYDELQRGKKLNYDTIGISNGDFTNVYGIDLLDSCFLTDDLDKVNLKMLGYDAPLVLNYQYGLFDVYCVIAPRVCPEDEKCEEIDYLLRV